MRVVPTNHALERFAQRWPGLAATASAVIEQDVAEALEAGRVACHLPRPCWPVGPRPRGEKGRRYAWTPDHSRVYVIRRLRCAVRGRLVLVVTTFRRREVADREGQRWAENEQEEAA